jgi:hypothetical protein
VLVADAWNGRIQRFAPDLTYLSEFGVPGWAGRDVFQKPYLTVAADGTIYATDPATALVMVFNRDGAVRAAFGGAGSATWRTSASPTASPRTWRRYAIVVRTAATTA